MTHSDTISVDRLSWLLGLQCSLRTTPSTGLMTPAALGPGHPQSKGQDSRCCPSCLHFQKMSCHLRRGGERPSGQRSGQALTDSQYVLGTERSPRAWIWARLHVNLMDRGPEKWDRVEGTLETLMERGSPAVTVHLFTLHSLGLSEAGCAHTRLHVPSEFLLPGGSQTEKF